MIFKDAFSRIVEINGPLHMAFHMLQCIFVVYKEMMLWGQNILQWKRICHSKVSDSFDLCKQLLFLVLDEASRLSWDIYFENNKDIIRTHVAINHCYCLNIMVKLKVHIKVQVMLS